MIGILSRDCPGAAPYRRADYAAGTLTVMDRQPREMKIRWSVMLLMWIGQTLLAWVAPMLVMQDWNDAADYLYSREALVFALAVGASLAVLQTLFVFPVRKPGLKRTGRSVWVTLGLAAFAGVALVVGIIATGIEVWVTLLNAMDPPDWDVMFWILVAIQGLGWVVATPLLVAFTKRERQETMLARLAARLFTGTIVEVVAIVPLDVMIRRKHDCYCGAGTFWALAICGGVGLFALGPAIYLPILAKRRKHWRGGHCDVCGYDMTGTPDAERCPECGTGWRREPAPT